MKDVQGSRDDREIDIDKVGIRGLKMPFRVKDKARGEQQVACSVWASVDLPRRFKGTHMSRFVEILTAFSGEVLSLESTKRILSEMKARLDSSNAHVMFYFPYFIEKKAPVTGKAAPMEYGVRFIANSVGGADEAILGLDIPMMTVCPCSKEISRFGAHNQRGIVRLQLRSGEFIWIEDIVEVVEGCASSPVYPLLKREDEKFVTESSYENPRFVEDVAREVAKALRADGRVEGFKVECENFESIHNHQAYAMIMSPGWDRRDR